MRPPPKLQVFANFLTKKMLQLFTTPYSPDLSPPDYFILSKLQVMLKGLHFADVAEIHIAVTDDLKKVQKEEFSAAFQKLHAAQKPVYMLKEFILNFKKFCVFLVCFIF
jgi:hypothetical protein